MENNEPQNSLDVAVEFANLSETTKLSLYSAILTINSVLIGACSIMQSLNKSMPKSITLIYLLFSLIPMAIVFLLYHRLRRYQINIALKNIITAIETDDLLIQKFIYVYEKFKNEKEIKNRPQIMFALERMASFFTFINILFFIFIVYIA